MTLSLLAADPPTGELGMVIASSSPAVAARCAYIRPRIGVAATQNVTDPRLGPALLDALSEGQDPDEALANVRSSSAVVDRAGRAAGWSGERALGVNGVRTAAGCVAAGNLLAGEHVLDAMIAAFVQSAELTLTERLLACLRAAADAGGEAGPLRSAGLLISAEVPWPVVDLRVDDHDAPVTALAALWELYAPLCDDYVTRALNPSDAPAFGVPGDE
jgi:uncharacterized Ntn-hydrolase superfamily protein